MLLIHLEHILICNMDTDAEKHIPFANAAMAFGIPVPVGIPGDEGRFESPDERGSDHEIDMADNNPLSETIQALFVSHY
jgi:hypothetical protein